MKWLPPLWEDHRGATAAEFGLVAPLLVLLLLGTFDAGRLMWEYNRAEKATQMGARFAVSTDPIAPGLSTYSFAVDGTVLAGESVPTSEFESATCEEGSCACLPSGGDFCDSIGYDDTAFQNIVSRMSAMYPLIGSENVEVEYRNIGLGFAGDPNGPDVSTLVTVRLKDLTFSPIILFGGTLTLPDFRAALTLEDAEGAIAN